VDAHSELKIFLNYLARPRVEFGKERYIKSVLYVKNIKEILKISVAKLER